MPKQAERAGRKVTEPRIEAHRAMTPATAGGMVHESRSRPGGQTVWQTVLSFGKRLIFAAVMVRAQGTDPASSRLRTWRSALLTRSQRKLHRQIHGTFAVCVSTLVEKAKLAEL